MDAVELTEIASRLRARMSAEPSDAPTLAHCAGIWLQPRLDAACQLFGRRLVYDPSANHDRAIARHSVRVLLRAEGFAAIDDLTESQLDVLAQQLIRRASSVSSTATQRVHVG